MQLQDITTMCWKSQRKREIYSQPFVVIEEALNENLSQDELVCQVTTKTWKSGKKKGFEGQAPVLDPLKRQSWFRAHGEGWNDWPQKLNAVLLVKMFVYGWT